MLLVDMREHLMHALSMDNKIHALCEELEVLREGYLAKWRDASPMLLVLLLGFVKGSIFDRRTITLALRNYWAANRCMEIVDKIRDAYAGLDLEREEPDLDYEALVREHPCSEQSKKDCETWVSWMFETPLLKSLSTS